MPLVKDNSMVGVSVYTFPSMGLSTDTLAEPHADKKTP